MESAWLGGTQPTPYYPVGLILPGEYRAAAVNPLLIHGVFFGTAAALAAAGAGASRGLPTSQRVMAVWLLISGVVHLVVEGAFALSPRFYSNTDPRLLLQELWKEYSKADSRYAARDPFVTTMETFTAFVLGPLCLVCALATLRRAPWRWLLITLVSCCQLYGTVLYFATSWFVNNEHVRPEAVYVWFYFVTMNTIWIVCPVACIWASAAAILPALAKRPASKRKPA